MTYLWNLKDESQFAYIKRMELNRGKNGKEAAEIAARAVSERRRQEGHYAPLSAGDTGNPNTALEERTVAELRNIASNLNINIHGKMRKPELITAIRSRRKLGVVPAPRLPRRRGTPPVGPAETN